ncbi:hypothetical protein ACHAXT_012803 [Thalassiosira profunda]
MAARALRRALGDAPRASNNRWVASVAALASAAAAASLTRREEDSECSGARRDIRIAGGDIGGIDALLRQRRPLGGSVNVARCDDLLPYHRLSQRPPHLRPNDESSQGNAGNGGRSAGFGPWQPRMAASRKSLLHRRSRHGSEEKEMDMEEKYKIDHMTILGEGAYGRVHPARLVSTGEKVALKKISKRYTDSAAFNSETEALLRIYENGGHPNISGLRDMYEDGRHYYLFLDLARGGEMFDHLIQHGQYSEFDASRLVTEILSALAFLHNIGCIHADLKPENVLLCSTKRGAETVKLIDFGCSKVDRRAESLLKDDRQKGWNRPPVDQPSIGTKAYWAPERFTKGVAVTDAADLYALGVIVFIMLVGVHPFDTKGIALDEEIEEKIQKSPGPPMQLAGHLSPSARDFIKSLMERDPNKRLTAITALQHPWIRGVTPSSKIIEGSDTKLSMYQDLRDKLASGIFAALVHGENLRDKSGDGSSSQEQSLTHLLRRAFEVFDEEGKGYVSEDDLGRVISKVTGSSLSAADSKAMLAAAKEGPPSLSDGLSLSDFSQLFSRQHYKRGDFIYHPGDEGDSMYFINSGKVEVLTKKGHLVSILRHGDFFGEGSLLEGRNHRITATRCSSPCDVIRISKEDFDKFILSSSSTKRSLELKWRARKDAEFAPSDSEHD